MGGTELPYFKAKGESLDELAENEGCEGFLAKSILPRGNSSLGQILHGQTGLRGTHLWQRDSKALEFTYGPPSRWSGIDSDGAPLRVVSDEIDAVLNKLPLAKVRVGGYFRWNSQSQLGERQANVMDEITRIADSEKERSSRQKVVVSFELEIKC